MRLFSLSRWFKTSSLFGLALVAIPALAILAIEIHEVMRIVPEIRRSQTLVAHAMDVLTTAQTLERAMQDAERGQRGYLITGDPEYLKPYGTGAKLALQAFSRLKELTSDNPQQQRRWAALETEINVKLDELKQTIDLRRDQGFDAARRIVETDVGAHAMQAIDQILDAAIADENALLTQRQALGSEAEQSAAVYGAAGGVAAAILIIFGSALAWREFRRVLESERALAESERRFRLLVSGIEDYALFMLDRQGRVVLWNSGAERLKGYASEEIVGRHLSRFYTDEDAQRGAPDEALRVAAARGSFATEGWRARKDGSRFWARVLLTAIHDETGELQGFAKLTHDETKQKEAEAALVRETEERERAEAQLRQAQKMESLGQLTGGIAHDFNNMLGVIIASLEVLQRRLKTDDAKLLDPIRHALEASERSAALTHRLLAFSRQQPLDPKPIDVNRLVTGMSALLIRTLGEQIEIETVLAAGLWTVSVDVNQLENALLNLAVNARDAMADGGKLTIETANTHLDEAYAGAHSEVAPGQYVMIAVSDSGMGMSAETIEKAFEPFFTTKDVGRGTGLGLSQVYGFVKQSGGHIKIYSELAHGTTVKLYLPRTDRIEGPDSHWRGRPAPVQGRPETILVVEDNELLLDSVSAMLREQGYRVLTASSGAAALKTLEAEEEIHLLFTDVILPGGLNGRQLAEEACRIRPDLKVLFTTGYSRNAIFHQGGLDPGVELIVKPFADAALIARIQRLLAG